MSSGFFVQSVEQGLVYAILAIGVYLTFRILDFADLTVEGSFTLGAAVAATMLTKGYHPVTASLVPVLAGAAAGCITGILHTKGKVSGLLAGILTMTGLYSINLRVMGKSNVPLLREDTVFTLLGGILPKSTAALMFFAVVIVAIVLALDWFLFTETGFAIRATGDNEYMIRSLGVNTDNTKILGLALSNGLVAFSGALVAQYQGFADAGMGIGMIVAGLASVIIGEVLLGSGNIFRATAAVVGGSVVYRLAIAFALLFGFRASDLKLITAVLVIIALVSPRVKGLLKPAGKVSVNG